METKRVALITDSTCDIPDELLQRYGIHFVPSFVVWGQEALRDRIELTAAEFYRRLQADPEHPSTAQPTPEDFLEAYEAAQAEGAEEIVVITVSSGMSGTYAAARRAGEMCRVPVHCVDAKGPTMSVGWQVLAAARAREAGGDAQAMLEAADRARKSMVQLVCLDTLEYLHRGGRIGGATAFVGTLLNIKPLVRINHETGLVEPAERVRTRKKSLDALYTHFFASLDTSKLLRVAVLHGDAREEADQIAARIQHQYSPVEMLINTTSPVLGVHTGPRALALCGYTES
ncbi:MAG: DegV family protein [Chloroflexi bacterium]|nr:DegV family protein [Chloroflexota bacterium]